MPKNRKSNREAKKTPVLTMKEKRAMKKAKASDKAFLDEARATRAR